MCSSIADPSQDPFRTDASPEAETGALRHHALFVAFHYPPEAGSSGVLRTLKFTRYLEEFGWRCTVLTLRHSAYDTIDEGLERDVPASTRVVRTRYLNSKRHFGIRGRYPAFLAVPDRWVGWYPWAVKAGREVMRSDRADLVYSTSPHATAHLIGRRLARLSGAPWVADFRDPWYEEPPEPGTPAVTHWFARRLERRVVETADAVVASTRTLRETLASRYREQSREKFQFITNGYDDADFDGLDVGDRQKGEELVIVHAGSINSQFRDPRPLFRAISALANAGELETSSIRLRFIGAGAYAESREISESLREADLQNCVEFLQRMSYQDALEELAKADVCLLLQASEDTRELVPAKLFEYLRLQRPVLGLVLAGEASEIISEVEGGWTVDPGNCKALESVVGTIFERWRSGGLSHQAARLAALEAYDRRELTRRLARIFDSLVS